MSVDEINQFVDEFRRWIEEQGVPCLTGEHSLLVASWQEELEAAKRLLEHKPELPIAFLGPSQQGKSSLINALVGENILAVGGAVGACTCVITSVHYHPQDDFRAEIEFISLKDWRTELQAMEEALNSKPTDEDTEDDRIEWETERKAAQEKFKAVYRLDPPDDLSPILRFAELHLPHDIAHVMATGEPIVLTETNALTLRNRVRRYLVGREQHEDGQFWPLIKRVRIYGKFPVLANGVVLVDLPGLNDPNPAREQVTKRYLEEARHIWLVCNSQTGIDRVFTQMLRENGFLFRLFMEGRLDAFSVITTRIDDINLEAVLGQMGIEAEDFDGDHTAPLEFRRQQIASHVQIHLGEIAADIAARAQAPEHRQVFLDRVRSIPVFSVSTAAYLHAVGRMPLYGGMQFSPDESHVPRLIEHLHSITLEQSYQTQIEAAFRRLQMLHEQVRRFFLNLIRRTEQDGEEAREEWKKFGRVAAQAIEAGIKELNTITIRSEEALEQRCEGFEQRLADLGGRAGGSLQSVFSAWQAINWRSLQAAVRRGGEWFSRSLQRDFDFNRDVARAYLDLVPFVWDEFFGTHLGELVKQTSRETHTELQNTAGRLRGGSEMLRHQPEELAEMMEASIRTAGERFELESDNVRAELAAQIQRTRQRLSTGVVETAAGFMRSAYEEAANQPGGTGIKQRMLEILRKHAEQHAPELFVNMRQELAEGVAVLQSSMKPQLARIVDQGKGSMKRFEQNVTAHQIVTPENRECYQNAVDLLPQLSVAAELTPATP